MGRIFGDDAGSGSGKKYGNHDPNGWYARVAFRRQREREEAQRKAQEEADQSSSSSESSTNSKKSTKSNKSKRSRKSPTPPARPPPAPRPGKVLPVRLGAPAPPPALPAGFGTPSASTPPAGGLLPGNWTGPAQFRTLAEGEELTSADYQMIGRAFEGFRMSKLMVHARKEAGKLPGLDFRQRKAAGRGSGLKARGAIPQLPELTAEQLEAAGRRVVAQSTGASGVSFEEYLRAFEVQTHAIGSGLYGRQPDVKIGGMQPLPPTPYVHPPSAPALPTQPYVAPEAGAGAQHIDDDTMDIDEMEETADPGINLYNAPDIDDAFRRAALDPHFELLDSDENHIDGPYESFDERERRIFWFVMGNNWGELSTMLPFERMDWALDVATPFGQHLIRPTIRNHRMLEDALENIGDGAMAGDEDAVHFVAHFDMLDLTFESENFRRWLVRQGQGQGGQGGM
ncbi:hypothetical protein K402DRAFT_425052 [Aulographum hederae CBS 113979]|uniref:Uncharacterized protein n=1 Tax=Aulographum hederae CBS 113979 TaxID=1176131 RepID=A0A6G1GM91_9PEZI|nr:hypothetical protein K402DRAFT_425052 [Aulographum hederae CBS 113979]